MVDARLGDPVVKHAPGARELLTRELLIGEVRIDSRCRYHPAKKNALLPRPGRYHPSPPGGDHGTWQEEALPVGFGTSGYGASARSRYRCGAEAVYVAVPPDRDEKPIQRYSTFTRELHGMAQWLKRCGVRTEAIESTGVDWIPVFQLLESRGLEVLLINARHVKNVADCEWLRYLHSVGLLRDSFRPADRICAVRSLLRHRDS